MVRGYVESMRGGGGGASASAGGPGGGSAAAVAEEVYGYAGQRLQYGALQREYRQAKYSINFVPKQFSPLIFPESIKVLS